MGSRGAGFDDTVWLYNGSRDGIWLGDVTWREVGGWGGFLRRNGGLGRLESPRMLGFVRFTDPEEPTEEARVLSLSPLRPYQVRMQAVALL